MSNARLIVEASGYPASEIEILNHVSIGSASDNGLRLNGQNTALYHAIVVKMDDVYSISEIGTSPGLFVNNVRVHTNHPLKNGDIISLGDEPKIKFLLPSVQTGPAESPQPSSNPDQATAAAGAAGLSYGAQSATGSGSGSDGFLWVNIALSVMFGLAIVGIAALIYFLIPGNTKKNNVCGSVRIVKPIAGETISRATTITVSVENPECVGRISYMLDEQKIGVTESSPYEFTLEPRDLKGRFAGGSHNLSAIVETLQGRLKEQPEVVPIILNFAGATDEIGPEFIREKAEALAGQLSGGNGSDFVFEAEFIDRIRSQTREFRTDFYPAAEQHKYEINRTFRNNVGLSELFGYILALSRSRFVRGAGVSGCGVDSDGIGLWRLPQNLVRQYAQPGADATEEVWIAANHFKDLLGYFDGNEGFMCAVACFGESGDRAGQILQRAPDANQCRNFWKLVHTNVLTQDEISRVVCFMAAGIVAQNPARFGINSQSLSIRVR